MRHRFLVFSAALLFLPSPQRLCAAASTAGLSKVQDLIIYQDDKFYSSFPSIVRRPDGELLIAFRRAPERRAFGASKYSHTDPNSQLVLVRSRDGGNTWSQPPELLYAHPFGGSQDPCLLQLRDGSIICSSYGWSLIPPQVAGKLNQVSRVGEFVFLGGYLLRSGDGGHSWQEPIIPAATPGQLFLDPFGKPLPSYNRGAMCEGKDGRLYWVVAAATSPSRKSQTHLLTSADKGTSWNYSSLVAADDKASFNETSIYETPRGDLVAFLRTENFNDHTAVARSTNHGQSFQPWQDVQFQGHPHYALRLADDRVLLVYGYRHPPFGVRARVLDSECENVASAPEFVLRDDGGSGDLGYPWAVLLGKDRVLVVYYFNLADGTRYIAGTVLEIESASKPK